MKNKADKRTLIFDDPLDAMDLFYSASFFDFLVKNRRRNILILTHRIELPRYATEVREESVKLFNLFFEKIDKKLFRNISTKNVIDILLTNQAKTSIPLLLYLRFIFKGIDETKYSLLSECVTNEKTSTVGSLKPLIKDLIGLKECNKRFQKYEQENLKKFCSEGTSRESIILNEILWKDDDPYLTSMRHISETEPLGMYLIEKKRVSVESLKD